MKKLSILCVTLALFSFCANAQDAATKASTEDKKPEFKNQYRSDRRESARQRFENASPEEKQKMTEERQQRMQKNDQRQEFARPNEVQPSTEQERGYQEKMAQMTQKMDKMENRQERFKNASPEEKARMEKHREMMKSLSPEQRESAKKEMERHRAEMKRITGFDLPAPPEREGNPNDVRN